jgi:hypothetical protein
MQRKHKIPFVLPVLSDRLEPVVTIAMPRNNAFAHQRYSPEKPTTIWHLVQPSEPSVAGSVEYQQQMASVGQAYRTAGVRAIWLIHGTFAGDDALGLVRVWERIAPGMGRRLRQLNKNLFDRLAQDSGNYTAEYAAEFQRATGIPVERVAWSSENHHLARAYAAICLLDRLVETGWGEDDRVLLWGHSHAGNVFALLTNLLAAASVPRESFFQAVRCYLQRWLGGLDKPVWERVRRWLETPGAGRRIPQLDLVTWGTPIRYGWDTGGYAKLLHFIYHRPRSGISEHLTALPGSVEDWLHATDGDYLQQLGIAGTNLAPAVLPAWLADWRLGRLLQPGIRRRDLLRRLKIGQRVPHEGETLLVEYPDGPVARQLAGHAIYTRSSWLPYHAIEVARRFYGGE